MMKLNVKNMEQKILFHNEMMGQLSDGNWENTRPHDHWEVWSDLKWNDVNVSDNIGRNFVARKVNYNFANKDLLDIVGDRIILKINLWKQNKDNSAVAKILKEDHWALPDDMYMADEKDPRFVELEKQGISFAMLQTASLGSYDMSDLRKDCKGLSESFKIYKQYLQ